MKILHISTNGPWVQPLLHELEKKVDVLHVTPPKNVRKDITMTEREVAAYRETINKYQPDIIHVHGTENNFAQLQHFFSDIPVVVSIQGILTGCIPYATGGLSEHEVKPFKSLKNLMHRGGLMSLYRRATAGSRAFEEDILRSCRYFFCRTEWDRKMVMKYSPQAVIFQGDELLRAPFYSNAGQWNIRQAEKHTIFTLSGFNPIKGLHYAIQTLSALSQKYPDVTLRVPGIPLNIYNRKGLVYRIIGEEYLGYIRHLTETLHVKERIVLLPYLSPEDMVKEILRAQVFLSPSTIDNSPNSVCEAMMLGVPVVCTPVGGVPSIVKHEQDGLLATPDQLATAIDRLFTDESLAEQIGVRAHTTALSRHDKERTTEQYLSAYQAILKQ